MTVAGCPLCGTEGGVPVWAAVQRTADEGLLERPRGQLPALDEDIRQAMAILPAV